MASFQSAPSSRFLALTLLAAASVAACGDEAGPAAPKLFIYGPGGFASFENDASPSKPVLYALIQTQL